MLNLEYYKGVNGAELSMIIRGRGKTVTIEFPWTSPEDPTIDDVQVAFSCNGGDKEVVKILSRSRHENMVKVDFEVS